MSSSPSARRPAGMSLLHPRSSTLPLPLSIAHLVVTHRTVAFDRAIRAMMYSARLSHAAAMGAVTRARTLAAMLTAPPPVPGPA